MNRFFHRPQLKKDNSGTTTVSTYLTDDSTYSHSIPPFRMSTRSGSHALTIKTVHSLEAELIRLRESTKDALQQSWEEVETLQQQCAAHLDVTNQLEHDVVEARRKEEYWHKRCLEAEFKLLRGDKDGTNKKTDVNNSDKPNKNRSNSINPMFLMTWPSIGSKNKTEDDQNSELIEGMENYDFELEENTDPELDDGKVVELETKLKDRESAISSLEGTVDQHVKAMHSMQAEMRCMMETQRIKEKKNQSTFHRKENFLENRISILEMDVKKKNSCISQQKKKGNDYKKYIGELAGELERVLVILQEAEKNGIKLNFPIDKGN